MKSKEHQKTRNSGRFLDYTLPEFLILEVKLKEFDENATIDDSYESDFTQKLLDQVSKNQSTCQKKGGEK